MAYDSFTEYYAELLDETYDCVDRLVVNAYFPLGQSPGGFRTWWRRLEGNDEMLDNAHLMRMAGRFSRRVHGWARKKGIPVIHCAAGDRKHEIAQKHLPSDPKARGVFVILVSRAPAPVWEVERWGKAAMDIRRKQPRPYVNHYSFHILDAEWGHLAIKICGHPPFGAQILLNGHEYVARRAMLEGIHFSKEGNCFTDVPIGAGLARIADTLRSQNAIGRLHQVCDRWAYFCLCFALDSAERRQSGFNYVYSVYQAEYSRNLLFKRGWEMEQVFHAAIDRTRAPLGLRTLKTIFGAKQRPRLSYRQSKPPRCEVVIERPAYDLIIFKLHFGKLTLKVYTKGERVLRIESITHNARELGSGIVLEKLPVIVARLAGILERFLEVLRCVDIAWISDDTLDRLPEPTRLGRIRIGGLDINKPRARAVMEALVGLSVNPNGFTLRDLTERVSEILGAGYAPRQAAYDLKKLRAKQLVIKHPRARRYEATPQGLRSVAALLTLRHRVIKPLLAAAGKLKVGRKPKNHGALDVHYESIQRDMRALFKTLGIAA